MSKQDKIAELENELAALREAHKTIVTRYYEKCDEVTGYRTAIEKLEQPKKRREYAGSVAFDFWPLKDWVRLGLDKWSPGRYFQLSIGPIRIDFFEN